MGRAGFVVRGGLRRRRHRWLRQHRWLGPPLRDWEAHRSLPLRVKWLSTGMMLFMVALSAWQLGGRPGLQGVVLLCGALIVTLSMGIRHGFGLWLDPITSERGWSRETFAFALARND